MSEVDSRGDISEGPSSHSLPNDEGESGIVWTTKLSIIFLVVAFFLCLLLYLLTPSSGSLSAFAWTYREVVVDEVLLLLVVMSLLVPFADRHLGPILRHRTTMAWPMRVLAMIVFIGGYLLFAFWVLVDLLGGYGGPGYTFSAYPSIVSIYDAVGLNHITIADKQGELGFLSFCVSASAFILLRTRKGIGAAIRDGITLFAASLLFIFELGLWTYVPLDMYWHVATFASWSLGRYPTAGSPFVWTGNVYVLSNWLVLVVSSLLILISILFRLVRKKGTPSEAAETQMEEAKSGFEGVVAGIMVFFLFAIVFFVA